ncbi:MAG TPA: protein-glutamine glutaminase family protein, partial [Ignavibacteria bacterium]
MAKEKDIGILTVAAVRKCKGGEEILFNERQRIFLAPSTMKSAKEASRRLKDSINKKAPVKAVLNLRKGVVEKIDIPKASEIEKFRKMRVLLEKPSKSIRINVKSIDPTAFNLVDLKLKWPAFLLCEKVVPNYTKAKEIFDFCAKQSCHLPGPYNISPCIPFQYVRDGCYARAHKMRRIITTKYGYCCEKVFSFANQGYDTLAVKADKWGGCCVTWWYHVAPLIRVRLKILSTSIVLAMVIDPGMFDKPVLLSTWLSAQENTFCHPNANVSMYSIQPGTAYTPANYSGTAFSTDPSYTATDA